MNEMTISEKDLLLGTRMNRVMDEIRLHLSATGGGIRLNALKHLEPSGPRWLNFYKSGCFMDKPSGHMFRYRSTIKSAVPSTPVSALSRFMS